MNNYFIVLDVNSGAIHIVDEIVYDILDYYKSEPQSIYDKLQSKYDKNDLEKALKEIQELEKNNLLYTEDIYENVASDIKNRGAVVKALCLHMAHDCNLRCTYCFAHDGTYKGEITLMPLDIGKKAIDFLLTNSGSRKNLEVDFFGGEPLLNFDVVKEIVTYAREKEKPLGKNIRFTITTNGLLLDDEKTAYIQQNMHNVVLSLDGRKIVNDKMRKTINGESSYDIIMPKYKKFMATDFDKYYVRGTFTKENIDFCDDVMHLAELGFKNISIEPVVSPESVTFSIQEEDIDTICTEYEKLATTMLDANQDFNFFHFMIDLEGGPCATKRMVGCGAGTEYLAVTPTGELFPCHQFVSDDSFKIGDVENGITNDELHEKFANINIYTKEACKTCWGKFYCSGGCAANGYTEAGGLNEVYDIGCKLQLKRTECAIMIKAHQAIQAEESL